MILPMTTEAAKIVLRHQHSYSANTIRRAKEHLWLPSSRRPLTLINQFISKCTFRRHI